MGHRFLIVAIVTSTLLISDSEAGQPSRRRDRAIKATCAVSDEAADKSRSPGSFGRANNGAGNNARSSGEHP